MAPQGLTADRRRNLWIAAIAAVVLVATAAAAAAPVTDAEIALFRAVNDLPASLYVAIWPLMQYGTFITIPVLTLVALAFRRVRLAMALAIAGVGVYLIARVMKQVVERGRPGALLSDVEGREEFGPGSLGFPSGHAAVAGALSVVVAFQLSRRWAIAAVAVGSVVLVGRLYVGAHLPLDVIGGAALGAIGGAVANLVVDAVAPTSAGAGDGQDDAEPGGQDAAAAP